MLARNIYYRLKPFLPYRLQIGLRRLLLQCKRKRFASVWPIDERASVKPQDWPGWPEDKKFALVLTHDVEKRAGLEKCRDLMQLEQDLGFRSSFNFVPERYPEPYPVLPELRMYLQEKGFEIGVHGLKHDGKLYCSRQIFRERALRINNYLEEWGAAGFRSPAMHHNLEWIHDLHIQYDASTFDTDPFEPQPDGVCTIFPFMVPGQSADDSYVELPYTLPQDSTLFLFMQEKNIDTWLRKLDWIAMHGGMALLITHPDYMNFKGTDLGIMEYPARYYEDFLKHIQKRYEGQYWHVLPRKMAEYWRSRSSE
jgi:hypothetical protein